MRRVSIFFTILFLLSTSLLLRAQTPQISLEVFQDLSTVDLGAFLISNDLSGQPRIFQITIIPEGKNVVVQGQVNWKMDLTSGFREIFNFKTKVFKARSFTNADVGNSDIQLQSVNGDKTLAEELAKRGKPTGVIRISLQLYDDRGNFLNQLPPPGYRDFDFFNPAQTISILSPQNESSYDVGNVQAQWTPVAGATSYIIRACILPEGSSSLEDALNSGDPLIKDRDVGVANVINLSTILDRQWVGGQRIVLSVSAYISGPGGGTLLKSSPVTFLLDKSGDNRSDAANINPDLIRLANLISNQVNQEFVAKLSSGNISMDQIQITDENDRAITLSDFLQILSFLETHKEAVISINFTAK
ncbi:MAG: hypothetical protein NTX65_17195 [Ignavibacteriales bacterium]|nr:hypothetical protein [Ignavibacteriales bacterium]